MLSSFTYLGKCVFLLNEVRRVCPSSLFIFSGVRTNLQEMWSIEVAPNKVQRRNLSKSGLNRRVPKRWGIFGLGEQMLVGGEFPDTEGSCECRMQLTRNGPPAWELREGRTTLRRKISKCYRILHLDFTK